MCWNSTEFMWTQQLEIFSRFFTHISWPILLLALPSLLLVPVADSLSSKCSYTSLPIHLLDAPLVCVLYFFPFEFMKEFVKCNARFSLEGGFFSHQLWKPSPIGDAYSIIFCIPYNLYVKVQHVLPLHVLAYFVAQPWAMQ
jgi:hypothetical protein